MLAQFRLGDLHQAVQQHIPDPSPNHTTFATNPAKSVPPTKQPYGSGDTDDGYTLVFQNLDAFQAWREQEEERNMVEFVKGDTHGSKAVPPRFKDHTKLVCARHSRSGRKKYVKKHPERVRKVPSRKLEGQGCPASISYKTYYDTEEVRACYISQHSHEIGLANLPFTRRGRKAAVEKEKEKRATKNAASPASSAGPSTTAAVSPQSIPPEPTPVPHITSPQPMSPPTQHIQQHQHVQHIQQQQQQQQPQQQVQPHQPQPVVTSPNASQQMTSFSSAVSMLAPLPNQQVYPAPQQQYAQAYGMPSYSAPPPMHPNPSDRWENMSTLFTTVRDHARTFEYPSASVAALETVLIRLYLESPMGLGAPTPNLGALVNQVMGGRGPTVQQQQHGMPVGAGNEGAMQNDRHS